MTKSEAADAIYDFLWDYIEKKNGFLGAGADVNSDDKAAMVLAGATPWRNENKISILFRCASSLDHSNAPVTDWMNECVAAARAAHPEAMAIAEIVVDCVRAPGPGLEL